MSLISLKDKKTRPVVLWTTGLFICACVAVFLRFSIAYGIIFPVGILTVASLWLCPWQISLALLFSVIGDYMGSCGQFIGQMGFVAAAHIMYVIYFIRRYLEKVERDRKLTEKAKGFTILIILMCLFVAGVAFSRIIINAPAGVIRTGAGIYAILICTMLAMALLQRSSLYALGALLFVFSDFILAWNKFTSPIENAGLLIMIPYYLGQWLLYIRSTPFRVGPEMRLMRF